MIAELRWILFVIFVRAQTVQISLSLGILIGVLIVVTLWRFRILSGPRWLNLLCISWYRVSWLIDVSGLFVAIATNSYSVSSNLQFELKVRSLHRCVQPE
jgi:hypothetical protein